MFTLKIALGNDAMNSPEEVAAALRAVADRLDAGRTQGTILDANGNTVGTWDLIPAD